MWRAHSILFFILLFLAAPFKEAAATIQLPQGMNKEDREQALRLIGLSLSNKILSDPYPLGGYAGFEAGVSIESFPAEDLARLGSGLQTPQKDSSVARLTVGKGLYNDLDAFIQFTPYTRENEISQFGGIVRWGVYQAPYLPLSVGLLVYANSATIANRLSLFSWGMDVIGGVNVDNVAVFAGVGGVEASGVFAGDASGVTPSGLQEREYVSGLHSIFGGSIRFSNLFVALQIDRYALPVFSAKLGVRF